MKWIFIILAGGVLVFMGYSTYSSINTQLQSSAISKSAPNAKTTTKTSIEKVEKTVSNTKNPPVKPQAK